MTKNRCILWVACTLSLVLLTPGFAQIQPPEGAGSLDLVDRLVLEPVSNAALQAIGCLGMRACHTNNCPVGIATQKEHLRSRLIVEESAKRLARYFEASVELMKILARACGHDRLSAFELNDITTYDRELADLTGVPFAGVR